MPAGKYNQRVTIERKREAPIGGGEVSVTWYDVDTIWAAVSSNGATELNEHDQQVGEQTYRVAVRKSKVTDCVTNNDRLRWRGIYLNIDGLNFDPARVEWVWLTTQKKGA